MYVISITLNLWKLTLLKGYIPFETKYSSSDENFYHDLSHDCVSRADMKAVIKTRYLRVLCTYIFIFRDIIWTITLLLKKNTKFLYIDF